MVNRRKGLAFGIAAVALIAGGAWLRATGILVSAEVRAEFERPAAAGAPRTVLVSGVPEVVVPPSLDDGHLVARDGLALRFEDQTLEETTSGKGSEQKTSRRWRAGASSIAWAQLRVAGRDVDPALLDGLDVDEPFALPADAVAWFAPKAQPASNKLFWGGGTPGSPEPGDRMRIYTWIPRGAITVLAPERGRALVRETRTRERLGIPMTFDIGVARLGTLDATQMAEAQRYRIGIGAWMFRVAGTIPIVLGGWMLIAAAGNWLGRRDTGLEHPSQLVPVFGWLFMVWPLRAMERIVERHVPWPPAIAIACFATALALAVAMVALFRWLAERFPPRKSRRPGLVVRSGDPP